MSEQKVKVLTSEPNRATCTTDIIQTLKFSGPSMSRKLKHGSDFNKSTLRFFQPKVGSAVAPPGWLGWVGLGWVGLVAWLLATFSKPGGPGVAGRFA